MPEVKAAARTILSELVADGETISPVTGFKITWDSIPQDDLSTYCDVLSDGMDSGDAFSTLQAHIEYLESLLTQYLLKEIAGS